MRRFTAYGPALVVLMTCAVALLAAPAIFARFAHVQATGRVQLARQIIADDDLLERIDRAVASVADSVRPSIVHITPPRGPRGFSFGASGAGWAYDAAGHIVTNAHVVRGAERFSVEFADGRVASAQLIGADPYTDVAVIKADTSTPLIPMLRAGDSLPRQGERVFAFGSPFGFKFSMSQGIISGLGRAPQTASPFGGYTNFIQTDAAVNPGNSGGPLVNIRGEVVGMNVAIATGADNAGSEASSGDSAGISFAIPVATIEPIVDQIIRTGRVSRGFLGVSFDAFGIERLQTDERFVRGLRVSDVVEGGPAASAGLRPGDIITQIQGQPVTDSEILSALIGSSPAGAVIPLTVFSEDNQSIRDVSVTLGVMPDEVLARRSGGSIMAQLGAVFLPRRADPSQAAPFVSAVISDSIADDAGFEVGQLITHVNDTPVETAQDVLVEFIRQDALIGRRIRVTLMGPDDDAQIREVTFRLVP
ncbi:MAG: trypsin-like peptidase domain-containing protein [Phycisphaerales bacterium JB059]